MYRQKWTATKPNSLNVEQFSPLGVDKELTQTNFAEVKKMQVTNGVYTRNIYSAGRKDVSIKVSRLNWNTQDSLVFEYIKKILWSTDK